MRISYMVSVVAVTLALAVPERLPAQQSAGAGQSRGMFGPRTLGQPLRPASNPPNLGLKIGPSGDFLGTGRYNAPNMFVTPWRSPVEPAQFYYEPAGVWQPTMPAVATTPAEGAPIQAQPTAPVRTAPEAGAPAQPGTPVSPGGPEIEPSGDMGATAPPVAAIGPPMYVVPQFSPASARTTARLPAESFQPAPAISSRLTRIARAHGIQTPTGISVSIANGIAVLQGLVGTQHDRTLLGNLVMLEPGISQVDNRLMVAPEPLAAGQTKR